MRYALVAADAARVAAYMPANYVAVPVDALFRGAVEWDRGKEPHALIVGEDAAGWTLDDYVIPRLASGLYFAEEVTLDELERRLGGPAPLTALMARDEVVKVAGFVR